MRIEKIILFTLTIIGGALALSSCFTAVPKGVRPVENFQVQKYLGRWYEIARFDFYFEKNINDATANYYQNPDGSIKVVNKGFNEKKNKWVQAIGEARPMGDDNLANLKVSFFKPIWASYIVIDLVDYRYALVAGRNKNYLWILSREKNIPDDIKQRFIAKASGLGFDTSKLIWISHNRTEE